VYHHVRAHFHGDGCACGEFVSPRARLQITYRFFPQSNIIACSVLGAYTIISPIDHYIGSNLKYIVINNVRRAVNPNFKAAIVDPPFQTRGFYLHINYYNFN
jgi:hypothetical protein